MLNEPVAESPIEQATDAIVTGDLDCLRNLLREQPDLVRLRSARPHHSTLLHYVSANGVEDSRQLTPPNIIAITQLLLDAGADPNAESDAYAGHSTALNLTATSVHPERAGIQLALLQLLLDRGAEMKPGDVTACLRNGRGLAACFLAERGAPLDLESAAGVGRLDLVRQLAPYTTSAEQMRSAFAWACEFGQTQVVRFLLDAGNSVDEKLPHHGQTGLHWAAFGGHVETARLLLEAGAALEAKDDHYSGTPLDWALHAAAENKADSWNPVITLLVNSGAEIGPERLGRLETHNARLRADTQ